MRRLMLLRHAKSSWANPGQGDFERPLAPRGLKAAPRMARYMADHGLVPQSVICSPARRTRATLDLMLDILPPPAAVRLEEGLYEAGVDALLAAVRASDDAHGTLMIVGHNPTLQDSALLFANKTGSELRRILREKFPTGALAVIDFDTDHWRDAAPASGTLSVFVRPRDLEPS